MVAQFNDLTKRKGSLFGLKLLSHHHRQELHQRSPFISEMFLRSMSLFNTIFYHLLEKIFVVLIGARLVFNCGKWADYNLIPETSC